MGNDGGNGSNSDDDDERERNPDDEWERDPDDERERDPDDERERDSDDERERDSDDREDRDRPEASAVSLSLDETLELLANYERRRILGYLMNAPDATATADELVDHLAARRAERTGERPGRDHVATTLHHVHLPRLADAGVVDYDARSQEVRYWRDDRLEEWYDCIRNREER